jgi:Zn-dependent protease
MFDDIIIIAIILTSVAIHEFAHCWTTDRLGDPTPRNAGRVTINPLVHLDLVGTIMIIISTMSGFGFGWGKPSPMNPSNFKNPAFGRMISAFAGPMSNILQMFAWIGILQLFNVILFNTSSIDIKVINIIEFTCTYGIILNAVLAIFNLLPIYPLDGHHILSYLVPYNIRHIVDNPAWQWVLLILIFTGGLQHILRPTVKIVADLTHYLIGIQIL